ncbi:sulfatase [Coraliomargarita sp. SDUM461004]|uniref:Sulfatase n=1 Tax=Thalassobacterium sedimentorum TaxID=3041258 RepID=A0ABU1AH71_9BACT|nr:sulfatase [Coraliomargarita sp. SDUM461004]MDQ8194169.1 sulfatase [Coraliomargarita sp. SDUM461004]
MKNQIKPLNILYLHSHDTGRYCEPYGYAAQTPHIQKLAEEGVIFRKAYCGNPTCSPSRACLLTGQSAHAAGMFGLAHRGWTLNDYKQTLINFLKEHGYFTALSGIQHIALAPYAEPEDAGYDEILTLDGSFDTPVAAAEDFLARQHKRPFFLDVGLFPPHRTGNDGDFPSKHPPTDERYVMPPAVLPDTPESRHDYSRYLTSVRGTDESFGQVLSAIDRYGYRDNTLVICTTDHGPAFPHMKCRLTDHGIGVMLIMRGPHGFSGGKVIDEMVSQVDLFPSICNLLNLPKPTWLEGQSFLPLLHGDNSQARQAIFAEVNYHAAEEPGRAVRTNRWKYIRRYTDYNQTVLPNIDNSISKTYLYNRDLKEREEPKEFLFDLCYDPQEANNLAAAPQYKAIKNEMEEALRQWMRDTGDPLFEGVLPKNDRMIVTPQHHFNPDGNTVTETSQNLEH